MSVWRRHRLLACLGWCLLVWIAFSSITLLKGLPPWKSSSVVWKQRGSNFLYWDSRAGVMAISGKFTSKSLPRLRLKKCIECLIHTRLRVSLRGNCMLGRAGALREWLPARHCAANFGLCKRVPWNSLLPPNENLHHLLTADDNSPFIPTPHITGAFVWPSKTAINFHLSIFCLGLKDRNMH